MGDQLMEEDRKAIFIGKVNGRDCYMKISPYLTQIKFDDKDIMVNPNATITQLFDILMGGQG